MKKPEKEITYYSPEVKGDHRNYDWRASFDYNDGYIGISQLKGADSERVLLTPQQTKSLIAFINDPVDNQK